MLTKRIIPCFDVDNGRVVKGISFVELRDAGDPVELAARYDREGADELVFLDITASSDNRESVYEMIGRTADQVFIPLTVGGGIRTPQDMRMMLETGADKVAINTAAVQNPGLITEGAQRMGSQCIVVSVDAKRVSADAERWEVYTHGGRTPTGRDAVDWAREAVDRGAGELLVTSMDSDGHQEGYDLPLLRAISDVVPVPVIASGGAGRPEHLYDALTEGGAAAVLAASIFHFGTYTIASLKEYLAGRGLPMRPVDTGSTVARARVARVALRTGERMSAMGEPAAIDPSALRYDRDGLVPAVLQEAATGEVLMVGYMNEQTLRRTLEIGQAVFWSRSRSEVWHKGATSGDYVRVLDVRADCEGATHALLLRVELLGDAICHTGSHSCFIDPDGDAPRFVRA